MRNSVLAFIGVIPSEKVTRGCVCIRHSINNINYFLFKGDLPGPRKYLKLLLNKSGLQTHTQTQTHMHTHTHAHQPRYWHKHIVFSEHANQFLCILASIKKFTLKAHLETRCRMLMILKTERCVLRGRYTILSIFMCCDKSKKYIR